MKNLRFITFCCFVFVSCVNQELVPVEEVEVIESKFNPEEEPVDTVKAPSVDRAAKLNEIRDAFIKVLDEASHGAFGALPDAMYDVSSEKKLCADLKEPLAEPSFGLLASSVVCDEDFAVTEDEAAALTDYVLENYVRKDTDFPVSGFSRYVELALIALLQDETNQAANLSTLASGSMAQIGGIQEAFFDSLQPGSPNVPGDYRVFAQWYSYTENHRTEIQNAYDNLSAQDKFDIQTWANNKSYGSSSPVNPSVDPKIQELGDAYLVVISGSQNGGFLFPPYAMFTENGGSVSNEGSDTLCNNLQTNVFPPPPNPVNCDAAYIVTNIESLDSYVYGAYENAGGSYDTDFPIPGLSRYVELALITIIQDGNTSRNDYLTANLTVEPGNFDPVIGGFQEFFFDNFFNAPGDYRLFNQAYRYTEDQRTEILNAYDALTAQDESQIQTWAENKGYSAGGGF